MQVRTLGRFVEDEGILASLRAMISDITARATKEAVAVGKQSKLPVVQCFTCTATTACCHSSSSRASGDFREYLRQLPWPTVADAERWRRHSP
jgi:hypothetical protein